MVSKKSDGIYSTAPLHKALFRLGKIYAFLFLFMSLMMFSPLILIVIGAAIFIAWRVRKRNKQKSPKGS